MLDQLEVGGVMIIPVGSPEWGQQIILYTKESDGSISEKRMLNVRYVPLTDLKTQRNGFTLLNR